jgi:two-component sensor histidine kinase
MLGGRRNRLRQLNLAAIAQVQDELLRGRDVTPAEVLPLLQSLTQHLTLVERLTSDQRYRRMLLLWRAIHVPMTVALVAALAVHVLVVFYDW